MVSRYQYAGLKKRQSTQRDLMKSLKKLLDPVARKLGLYTAYPLDSEEFVGEEAAISWTERDLRKVGYEPSPRFLGVKLQATKLHPDTGKTHDGSLRRVDPQNSKAQYHIHWWDVDGQKEVYSHYELRPDFCRIADESVSDMIRRLRKHFRADKYIEGMADQHVKAVVQ
jgi:hypothetical protein